MTIKQHGGVFGRNPKFNSVEAESLTIAGNAVPDASTILVDGDIGSTVQGYDADTAKLDAAQTFTAAQTFNENIVMANAKGIDFSATSDAGGMTSELFDDYEEGTFTPTVIGVTTAGAGTYTTQLGKYTKIGNVVHVQIQLAWTAHTGTGGMKIAGLPFTSASTGPVSQMSIATFNMSLTAGNFPVARQELNTTDVNLLQSPTGGGSWGGINMDTNVAALEVTGTYTV